MSKQVTGRGTSTHSADQSPTGEPYTEESRGTSIGVKLIYVLITGFLSLIPLIGVQGVLELRDRYAAGVVRKLETNLGGQQKLLGPVVVVPTRWADEETFQYKTDQNGNPIPRPDPSPYYFIPNDLNMSADIKTDRHTDSLYAAIGYAANIDFMATYDFKHSVEGEYQFAYASPVNFEWNDAYAILFMANTSSTKVRPQLIIGGDTIALSPGIPQFSKLTKPALTGQNRNAPLGYSAPIGRFINFDSQTTLETTISFEGATRLTIAPIGKTTELKVASDGAPDTINPFNGDAIKYESAEDGPLGKTWSTAGPFREGNAATFSSDLASPLLAKQNFVAFFDAKNIRPYADIKQALRYGFFLLGFSFLTFFVFDALSQRYLHAAQYFLLGLIQTVFYAVLLAVSEFTGFEFGFLVAAVPTVVVTGIAVASILRSFPLGILSIIIFGAFYSVQYILMDMAQYSLLVAAGAAFIAIAATLLATSRLDWGRFKKTA